MPFGYDLLPQEHVWKDGNNDVLVNDYANPCKIKWQFGIMVAVYFKVLNTPSILWACFCLHAVHLNRIISSSANYPHRSTSRSKIDSTSSFVFLLIGL